MRASHKIILISCIAVVTAMPVFAAEFLFDTKSKVIAPGDEVKIDFLINTEGDNLNALEAAIVFPKDILELTEIRDGNSLINFWVERPHEDAGSVRFSGIVPGGYTGSRGLLFSLVFRAKKQGNASVEAHDVSALRNDGAGTAARTRANPLRIIVSARAPRAPSSETAMEDHVVPEAFTPEIARDSNIFEGKYFLVFATQDKGLGIDYYEVREGGRPFVRAESPYVLQNQKRDEEIEVKAVDKAGNERLVRLAPPETYVVYRAIAIWVILLIVIGAAVRYRRTKKKRSHS